MIKIKIPHHLRVLVQAGAEVELDVEEPVTLSSLLDALESRYPVLRGTIRDHITQQRRPFLRFFACGQDITHEPPGTLLPDEVATGDEPLVILGAIVGG